MTTIKVAAVQLSAGTDKRANLDQVAVLTARAVDLGAELVVFPEATMCRFGVPLREVAEPVDGPWAQGLTNIADASGVVVVAGMFTHGAGLRVRNTLRAVGPGVDAHYDKIHLFDAFGFRESETVEAGTEPVVIKVGEVTIGLTTCYDVRFPGLYTALADQGAQVCCVAASWGAGPGKVDQWQVLTRARALDATTFVIAAGQAEPDGGMPTVTSKAPTGVGHSAIISPTGVVLGELAEQPGLMVVELELTEVEVARSTIPVLANRKF